MRFSSRMIRVLMIAALLLAVSLFAAACGSGGGDAPTGTASEIAGKVFTEAGVEPFGPTTSITNDQEMEYFLGSTNYPEFSDTAIVQPMISIDARMLYILKVASDKDASAVMEQLKIDVDPTRLICVAFSEDDVTMKSRGDVVYMVIDADHDQRDALTEAFEAID